jgi:hypothetical protein
MKLRDLLNEKYQTFGASDEDEKRAAQGIANKETNFSLFKNSDAFKREIKSYYLKSDIKKLSDGRVSISGGSKAHLHFKTSGTFDKKNVETIFKPLFVKFKGVHGAQLYITNWTDKGFTLTTQKD